VRRNALAITSILVMFPATALAADAGVGDAGTNDPAALLESIRAQGETLSTDDCVSACKALDSMRRATTRLCSLDPGRRCSDARAVLDDATRRVRAACPACAVPEEEPGRPESAYEKPGSAPKKGAAPPADTPAPASAPPQSERERGGCLGCGGGSSSAATSIVGALAVALALSRRRPRRP
jgi:hypothetical protein